MSYFCPQVPVCIHVVHRRTGDRSSGEARRAVSPGVSAKPRLKGFFALHNSASQKDKQVRWG